MKRNRLFILASLACLLYSCDLEDDIFGGGRDSKGGAQLSCDNLTFETVDPGNYIEEIHTETGYGPLRVYARARNSDGELETDNRAMLFDSENWTGDDDDLIADWGNVLIIQEIGEENEPNDNRWGGEIEITFPEEVTVRSLRVLDIDNREGDNENNCWAILYNKDGKELHRQQFVPLGNNSRQTIDLGNTSGVTSIKVIFDGEGIIGSGAIDNIEFCVPADGENEEELIGCTRIRTYWLDHADPETETYNAAWNDYREQPFFDSGSTYLQLLQKTPMKGNAYFMLAQSFITAKLSVAGGASTTTEVDEALAGATAYFNKETEPEVAELLVWAGILDAYNEGEIGPGQCRD
ncbi:hypothetical protein WG947_04575 [Pontibacter sp. H259]|uniref:hypothetical protein n=1 Tax=Pontibacter sp. H259 TaxID=3133421 RepID=UPI0030BC0C50